MELNQKGSWDKNYRFELLFECNLCKLQDKY